MSYSLFTNQSICLAKRAITLPIRRYQRFLQGRQYCYALREQLIHHTGELKVIVGASSTHMPDWISTEYPYVNIASWANLQKWFVPESMSAILAEHVWEHLTQDQALDACRNCFRLLKSGGYLRLAVPDGNHPDTSYIDAVKPGGYGPGSDDHKVLYRLESLTTLLETAGFVVRPLEWFDTEGMFHKTLWDPEMGMVSRSTRFDERNSNNPTAYTSLIVDAFKLG